MSVSVSKSRYFNPFISVEEVLNCKVTTTSRYSFCGSMEVEEVLNYKVKETIEVKTPIPTLVDEVLEHSNS